MSTERNLAVSRRALEDVWSKGDIAAANALYAEDCVSHQLNRFENQRDCD